MELKGTWRNELGSTLVIDSVTDGVVTGTYTTAVSTEACAQGSFVVAGRTDTDTRGTSVGWSVVWKNPQSWCHSVTSWAGQLDSEQGLITAFWLLSSQTPDGSSWASTNVGVDHFSPVGAEAAEGGTRRVLGLSHP